MGAEHKTGLIHEQEPKQANPEVLICGYCKSGTTIITKTFAHCVGQKWKNEARSLWGIGEEIDRSLPLTNFHSRLGENGKWQFAQEEITSDPVLKFPEGILIVDLFPPNTSAVCVVRNPLDTVCAYLERLHEFKTLEFTPDELVSRAADWNYHYLASGQARRKIQYVRYEDFVQTPDETIRRISDYVDMPMKNNLPDWIEEQALPYHKFLADGHEVRGIGRFNLSIKSPREVDLVLETCRPALDFLNTQGINFKDVL